MDGFSAAMTTELYLRPYCTAEKMKRCALP